MSDEAGQLKLPPSIRYDYLKSNLYRVVHADGIVGGLTPGGTLIFSVFNERTPIPQQVSHAIEVNEETSSMALGDEIVSERVSRQALVREVEVGVIMDYRTAVLLRDWLSQQLEKLKPIEAAKRKEPL